MKILILVLLIIVPIQVKAKTIYSDYGEFSKWQEEEIIKTDLLDVEKKKFYKYSYDEKVKYGYLDECRYEVDKNDIEYGEYSNWQMDIIEKEENIDVEQTPGLKYHTNSDIRYILLTDVSASDLGLVISEIEMIAEGKTIKPDIIMCKNCYDDNGPMTNKKYTDNNSGVYSGGYILFDLRDSYDYKNFKISMWLYDNTNQYKKFRLYIGPNKTIDDAIAYYDFSVNYSNKENTSTNYQIMMNRFEFFTQYIHPITDEFTREKLISENYHDIEDITLYRKRNIKYLCYKTEEKLTDYILEAEDNYKRTKEYKYFYRYRNRNYITIEDNIEINRYDFDYTKVIKSDLPYSIIGLDLTKNMTQKVNIKNSFTNYSTKIKVNIPENELLEKNNQINASNTTINMLLEEIELAEQVNNQLNNQLEVKNEEIKTLTNSYEEKINSKNNIIISRSNCEQTENEEKKENNDNSKLVIGISLIIFSMLLTIYIYYKS